FSSNRHGSFNIFSYNLKNKKIYQHTDCRWAAFEPHTLPEKKILAFTRLLNGRSVICIKKIKPILASAPKIATLLPPARPILLQDNTSRQKIVTEKAKLLPEGYGKFELRFDETFFPLTTNSRELKTGVGLRFEDPLKTHNLELKAQYAFRAEKPNLFLDYENTRESLFFKFNARQESFFREEVFGFDFVEIQRGLSINAGIKPGIFSTVALGCGFDEQDFDKKEIPDYPLSEGYLAWYSGLLSYNNLSNDFIPRGIIAQVQGKFYEEALGSDYKIHQYRYQSEFNLRVGPRNQQAWVLAFKGWNRYHRNPGIFYPMDSIGGIDEFRSLGPFKFATNHGRISRLAYRFPHKFHPNFLEPLIYFNRAKFEFFSQVAYGKNFFNATIMQKTWKNLGIEYVTLNHLFGKTPITVRLGAAFTFEEKEKKFYLSINEYYKKFL
ncbi:hypothetical protein ACFL35_21670, partial [Candidatus Riflebacteria bacterium]